MVDALHIKDLKVTYSSRRHQTVEAVRSLSLNVEAGEIVGFLGPNGAGKSSTLKAIMGFVPIQAGNCRVFDAPAGSIEARKHIGYLPEVAMYYPYLTPLETLTLYGEVQGLSSKVIRDQAGELLEIVGISKHATVQNRKLSKGMLQRVGIAQSLIGNPSLLVLDEVTSGLDPIGRHDLRELLKNRRQQGSTLFFSSHELGEVEQLCDRILLINQGQLIEERHMEGLMDELRKYKLVYRGASSLIDLAQEWEPLPDGTTAATFATMANLLQAINRVQQAKGEVVDVVSQEGSLEAYFVDRLGRAA